jgi:hypothetical protein
LIWSRLAHFGAPPLDFLEKANKIMLLIWTEGGLLRLGPMEETVLHE